MTDLPIYAALLIGAQFIALITHHVRRAQAADTLIQLFRDRDYMTPEAFDDKLTAYYRNPKHHQEYIRRPLQVSLILTGITAGWALVDLMRSWA